MTDRLDENLNRNLARRACEALGHWPFPPQTPVLLKYRENAVFRVTLTDGRFAALRLHRPGYHGLAALHSELDWMTALHADGIDVPNALSLPDGKLVAELPANETFPLQYADVVSWMDGAPLGETGKPLDWSPPEKIALFHSLGATMAAMHDSADRFRPAASFFRPAWNIDGLLGENPLWGRFWDCSCLSEGESRRLSSLRDRLTMILRDTPASDLDYGLIHADLIRENVLVTDGQVSFIDFDDCGYGFRMFDIATALLKNRNEPDYAEIEAALIAGYRERRLLTDQALATLPIFLTLRSLTYIGWLSERTDVPDTPARLKRYLADSFMMAELAGLPA